MPVIELFGAPGVGKTAVRRELLRQKICRNPTPIHANEISDGGAYAFVFAFNRLISLAPEIDRPRIMKYITARLAQRRKLLHDQTYVLDEFLHQTLLGLIANSRYPWWHSLEILYLSTYTPPSDLYVSIECEPDIAVNRQKERGRIADSLAKPQVKYHSAQKVIERILRVGGKRLMVLNSTHKSPIELANELKGEWLFKQ